MQLIDRRPIIDVVIEYQWDPLWSIPVMVNHLIKVIRTEVSAGLVLDEAISNFMTAVVRIQE